MMMIPPSIKYLVILMRGIGFPKRKYSKDWLRVESTKAKLLANIVQNLIT
jgi:hypothetical protein